MCDGLEMGRVDTAGSGSDFSAELLATSASRVGGCRRASILRLGFRRRCRESHCPAPEMLERGNGTAVETTGSNKSASLTAREMKKASAQGIFALHGKLLYLLWVTYKMADVGQPRPTALATSMGATGEGSPFRGGRRLEHPRQGS